MQFNEVKIALAVSAALASIGAQAQESVRTEEVRVTASRVEQELMDVPMSVSVVTAQEIEQGSGKTVADFLDDIPGVEVQNDGSQGLKRLQIRGESPFRTVVMIDGQKISEHKSMSGTPILIDPSMIERIEVIKGPASVLYGSDAIGGAVNIITKKGGSKPFQASVSAGYDSSGNGRTLSGSIYGAVNGWEYRVSGAIEEYDDLDTPVGKVDNTNFSSRSASAYLAYNVNSDIKLGASLDTFDLETYSANQIGVMQGSMRNFAVDVPEWKRTKGAVFYEHKNITDNFVRLRLDAFLQQTDKDMHNLVMPNMGSSSRSMEINNWADNELKQTSLSVQTDWQFGESYFILGYEYSHETLDASTKQIQDLQVAMTPIVSMNQYSSGTEWYDAEQNRHSVYLSGETPVLDAVTLEREAIGGQMMLTSDVDNYPGVPSANAFDLVDAMRSQAEGLGARIEMAPVTSIEHDAKTSLFRVSTFSDEYLSPSVVAALGARPRLAGFLGEHEFTGRGVSYCATCDGMFYRNKHVFVIGGGNSAAEEALFLARIASRVTLVVRKDHLRAQAALVRELESNEKVEIRLLTSLVELDGDEMPQRLVFRNNATGETYEETFEPRSFGVFVLTGRVPETGLLKGLVDTDEAGYAITDERMATRTPGLFVAGDARAKPLRQIVTAASDGAVAATSAAAFLGRPIEG